MNFFEQLSASGNVDITIRIMQKNNRLTLNVMPGSGSSTTKPMIITGTPQELDAEFFSNLYPQVDEVNGIIHNIEEVKKEALQKAKPAKPEPSKAEKPAAKEKSPKKAEKQQQERVNLFADAADSEEDVDANNDQSSNDDSHTQEDVEADA